MGNFCNLISFHRKFSFSKFSDFFFSLSTLTREQELIWNDIMWLKNNKTTTLWGFHLKPDSFYGHKGWCHPRKIVAFCENCFGPNLKTNKVKYIIVYISRKRISQGTYLNTM